MMCVTIILFERNHLFAISFTAFLIWSSDFTEISRLFFEYGKLSKHMWSPKMSVFLNDYLLFLLNRWRNWGTDWFYSLPSATQILRSRTEIEIQAIWLQNSCSTSTLLEVYVQGRASWQHADPGLVCLG